MPVGAQEASARGFDVEKQKSPSSSSSSTSMPSNFAYGPSVGSSTAQARHKFSTNVSAAFPFVGFNGNGLNSSPENKGDDSEDGEDDGDYSSSEEDTAMNNYQNQNLKQTNVDSSNRSRSPTGEHPVITP